MLINLTEYERKGKQERGSRKQYEYELGMKEKGNEEMKV